jgi:hypothetical protein
MNSSPFFPPQQFALNSTPQVSQTTRPKCGFSNNSTTSAAQAYIASISIMLGVIVMLILK